MTAQAQLGVPALDDNMDLATSPFETVDDFDIDFDQMDNQDTHDTANHQLVDLTEADNAIDDVMQADEKEDFLEDENMDEAQEGDHNQIEHDFDMDEAHLNEETYGEPQDDDVLYDEDEDEDEQPATTDEQAQKGDVEHAAHDDGSLGIDGVAAQPETDVLPEEISHVDEAVPEVAPSADPRVTNALEDVEEQSLAQSHDAIPEGVDVPTAAASTESAHLTETKQHDALEIPVADYQAPSGVDAEVAPEEDAQDPTAYEQEDEPLVEDSAVQEALHAIRVGWGGKTFPLFPESDGDASQSFVADTSLAYESLSKLLAECHHVIKPELDRAFEDELVLDVDTLGLHICEDSKYAEQLSLAHVVEVYILLKRNESEEPVAPLPCRISSRTCLRSQYDYLHDAAKQRRTFSSIVSEADPNSPLAEAENHGVLEEAEYQPADEPDAQEVATEDVEDLAPAAAMEGGADATTTGPFVDEQQAMEAPPPAGQNDVPEAATTDSVETSHAKIEQSTPAQKPQDDVAEEQDFVGEELFEGLGDEEAEQVPNTDFEPEATGEADGSTSSHTVEGESKLFEDDPEVVEPDDIFLDEEAEHSTIEPTVDGGDAAGADQLIGDDNEDYIYDIGDEPLNAQASVMEDPAPQNQVAVDDNGEADASAIDHEYEPQANIANGDDLVAPPITPQKAVPAKRKAVEEEEEDLLDFGFDTPEPKRQRPS